MRVLLTPGVILLAALTACTGNLGSAGDKPDEGSGGDSSTGASAGKDTGPGASGSTSLGGSGAGGSTGTGSTPGTGGSASSGTGGSVNSSTGGVVAPPPMDKSGRYVCEDTTHGVTAAMRRITQAEYNNVITDVFGVTPGPSYPGGYGKSGSGFSTESALNAVGEQSVEKIMNAAEEVASLLPARLPKILSCASKGDEACAKTYLTTVGRRAFRRALTTDEQNTLLAVYKAEMADTATFADAVSVMTAQMLQMPAFLYVVEAPGKAGVDRALTGPELASRISFQLWDSAPDDALLDAADGGKLATKADVLTQAKRLFADARSDRGFTRFFREWTGTDTLTVTMKDAKVFTYLNQAFVTSVNDSFNKFVVDQVRSGKTLYDALRSNSMFIDKNLATFFGQPAVTAWTQVSLDATRYSGLMTQPGMLAALAHSTDTSYVFRGRFIRKRLLCQDIGTPPANAMAEFANLTKPANPTAREVASVVESQPACGGCHNLLDPGGLAFEHFDAMGAYRDKYASGKAIDTTGALAAVTTAAMDFDGPVDLMEQLAGLPQTQKCFATQLHRYTVSRVDNGGDACAIQQIQDAMEASKNNIQEAFFATTQTDAFLYRRGE
jgi:hypothetical protein